MAAQDPNAEYRTLTEAFERLNAELFGGTLPLVLITYQRENRMLGYYRQHAFRNRTDQAAPIVSEIALNPDTFETRTDCEILSTLAHEMCHLWQAAYGTPSRTGYHNAQWAAKMIAVGLQPVRADGRPGTTGQAMTHDIIPGGAFDTTARYFLAGSRLHWQAIKPLPRDAAKKRASKTRYTCPGCGLNAWAKPGAPLMCADCEELMVADTADEG